MTSQRRMHTKNCGKFVGTMVNHGKVLLLGLYARENGQCDCDYRRHSYAICHPSYFAGRDFSTVEVGLG